LSVTAYDQPAAATDDGGFDELLDLTTRAAQDGEVTVSAAGEVDTFTAARLRSLLDAELERRPPALVVDLSAVQFLGSAGLAVLVEAQKAADARTVALRLIANTRAVIRPLEVTGLIDLFTVSSDKR